MSRPFVLFCAALKKIIISVISAPQFFKRKSVGGDPSAQCVPAILLVILQLMLPGFQSTKLPRLGEQTSQLLRLFLMKISCPSFFQSEKSTALKSSSCKGGEVEMGTSISE